MAAQLQQWALPRIQLLLPIDDDSLKQIITYADTLPKDQAARHLGDLLGTDPKALEFISSFNLRRQRAPDQGSTASQSANASRSAAANTNASQNGAPGPAEASGVPQSQRRGPKKKKKNIHELPARQVEGAGNVAGAYRKRDEQDYLPRHAKERQSHHEQVSDNLALHDRPADASQMPLITDDAAPTSKPVTSKLPPGASGQMVGEVLEGKKSKQASRTASPVPAKTKVNVTGGTAMHGASTALTDLDAAIRSLEVQTNPSLSALSAEENKRRQCSCMATRHPLLDMAPNCLNCGKVICVKEGLGPCTYCEQPLLSSSDISSIVRVLKEERGEEKMRANNASQKKADVGHGKSRAFTGRDFLAQTSAATSSRSSPLSSAAATPAASDDEDASSAQSAAKAHRDKLLTFQANNARRTQIHDEAADYDIPASGTNMWASPAERAQQLKKQQKMLREMEWNAKPEYEKRKVVASIDLKGGRIVRRMADVEKPDFGAEAVGDEDVEDFMPPQPDGAGSGGNGGGAFSNNPLAKGLVRPTVRADKGKGKEGESGGREKKSTWRRVQDDNDDNEQWILDGGVYGGRVEGRVLGDEEHAFG